MGFPDSSVGKESACNAGDPGLIPGSGRSSGEGIGYPLQCSWASLMAQLIKNLPVMWETWFRFLGWEYPLEKGKATTPVFWPGEFHWLCSLCGCKELDTTERLSLKIDLHSRKPATEYAINLSSVKTSNSRLFLSTFKKFSYTWFSRAWEIKRSLETSMMLKSKPETIYRSLSLMKINIKI